MSGWQIRKPGIPSVLAAVAESMQDKHPATVVPAIMSVTAIFTGCHYLLPQII